MTQINTLFEKITKKQLEKITHFFNKKAQPNILLEKLQKRSKSVFNKKKSSKTSYLES
jgi:hypothetical protein